MAQLICVSILGAIGLVMVGMIGYDVYKVFFADREENDDEYGNEYNADEEEDEACEEVERASEEE